MPINKDFNKYFFTNKPQLTHY